MKKGAFATDFREKVQNCVKCMRHAPVLGNSGGTYDLNPINPPPIRASAAWIT
jgi:hypothetical protein